jgi:transketolase
MNMRQQMVSTVEGVLRNDVRTMLLLGDIGVFGFRNAFEAFPERVLNIGILEQATIGVAAGLSLCNMIPIVHSIAPFLVERAFEQLKIDFGYQKTGGNFISVGASYDYAALGCTHHCPGDVGILKNCPGMEIVVPGTASEFDALFRRTYANGSPTYYRLSERSNATSCDVSFGKATVIRKGEGLTVVAVGPLLDTVLEAGKDLDITVLYYTTVAPFDAQTLKDNAGSSKLLLCEPYYSGVSAADIQAALFPAPVSIDFAGIPSRFLTQYGSCEEHDEALGLTAGRIRSRMQRMMA